VARSIIAPVVAHFFMEKVTAKVEPKLVQMPPIQNYVWHYFNRKKSQLKNQTKRVVDRIKFNHFMQGISSFWILTRLISFQ